MMDTASDLEVFSATTVLLVPLHISVFLAHLSSRVVEPGSKPPALFSGVELTYYRHQVACSVLIVGIDGDVDIHLYYSGRHR